MKKISEFLSENFQFLVVKFSKYLNRRVFVMGLNETVSSPCSGPFSQPTFRDNRPTSALSALIKLDVP